MSTEDDVRHAKEALQARGDALIRGLTLEMLSRIVERTPVDTGRAANNWNVSQDAPNETVTEKEGARPAVTAQQVEDAGVVMGGETYIVNGLPYIEVLEFGLYPPPSEESARRRVPKVTDQGFSTQAPAGMVRVTVAEVQPIADEVAKQVSGLTLSALSTEEQVVERMLERITQGGSPPSLGG